MNGLRTQIRRNPAAWITATLLVLALIAGAITLGGSSGGSSGGASPSAGSGGTPSSAVMLASLQTGYTVDGRDSLTRQFQAQLDAMGPLCSDSESRISDYTVTTHDILRKDGLSDSYLSVLSHVRQSMPAGAAPTKCADVFAAYAVLREGA